jgi:hypothetical protein
VTQLGAPFKIVDGVVSRFRLEVAKRIAAIKTAAGLPMSFSGPSMAESRWMHESWRDRSRKTRGRGHR